MELVGKALPVRLADAVIDLQSSQGRFAVYVSGVNGPVEPGTLWPWLPPFALSLSRILWAGTRTLPLLGPCRDWPTASGGGVRVGGAQFQREAVYRGVSSCQSL